jgi:hypothetical protein
MALDTYSNLKTTIANYLNRSDLTAYLGDFITLTEARLNRELRVIKSPTYAVGSLLLR